MECTPILQCSFPETLHRCEHTRTIGSTIQGMNFAFSGSLWSLAGISGIAKSALVRAITHTQEPDDHDHSDHNGTSVQLQEFKVVDSLSYC